MKTCWRSYVMDLDGFKPVNDQHGHDVGDELLVAVARRLQCHLRQSDVIARLGGDEFVVMTGELHSTAQAHELGLKLLEAFSSPFALGGIQVQVGLTIGYAIAPIDSQDGAGLIKLADAAMYSGKQSGKFCAPQYGRPGPVISLAILCANQAARVSGHARTPQRQQRYASPTEAEYPRVSP